MTVGSTTRASVGSSDGTTDARDDPLVSFVIVTYNRPDDLAESIASVLDQNYEPMEIVVVSNSTDRTAELFEEGGEFDRRNVHYHQYPGRMGVPKARNIGYELADGSVLVTLDDDAMLDSPDATDVIVSTFREHDDVGVLAFQCRDYYTDSIKLNETPDPPEFHMTPRDRYRATNFVGVGNAIRREVLDLAGDYPEDFVYGFEEMDLSLRIHDTGYDILYTPAVVVFHKKAPEGRMTDIETLERLVENRLKIAMRNLPWRYVLFTTLIWSVYGAIATRQPSSLGRIYRRLYGMRRELLAARSVVDAETIARIKSRKTMLFLWWYGPHPLRIFGSDGNLSRLRWEF